MCTDPVIWHLLLAGLAGMILQSIVLVAWGLLMDSGDPGRDA